MYPTGLLPMNQSSPILPLVGCIGTHVWSATCSMLKHALTDIFFWSFNFRQHLSPLSKRWLAIIAQ